jgi:chemotaxis response regulator CheB
LASDFLAGGVNVRILLADDHPLFRKGVRNLIQTTDDLEVVGEASSGEEVIKMAARHQARKLYQQETENSIMDEGEDYK